MNSSYIEFELIKPTSTQLLCKLFKIKTLQHYFEINIYFSWLCGAECEVKKFFFLKLEPKPKQ